MRARALLWPVLCPLVCGLSQWTLAPGEQAALRLSSSPLVGLSSSPRVLRVRSFLTHSECDRLIKLATRTGLSPAETGSVGSGFQILEARRAEVVWLDQPSLPLIQSINRRAAELFGSSVPELELSGGLQLVRYGPAGLYRPHFDSIPLSNLALDKQHFPGRPRAATLLYALQGHESGLEGGELSFPLHGGPANLTHRNFFEAMQVTPAEWAERCDLGLVLPLEKGDALLWYNHDLVGGRVGELDQASFHGGCKVRAGTKWIANQWLEAAPPYATSAVATERQVMVDELAKIQAQLAAEGDVDELIVVKRMIAQLSNEPHPDKLAVLMKSAKLLVEQILLGELSI